MNLRHRSTAAFHFFAVLALFLFLAGGIAQAASVFTPIRPPAVPLITRSPYVSTWLNADNAPGTWPTFWNGNIKVITGMVSIDGTAYLFLGAPAGVPRTMTQTSLQVTPTQSIYTFDGGGVTLTVDFLSPVESADMKRLSIPLSYITASAKSSDGKTHAVKLYFDISGEWAHGDSNAQIVWAPETISLGADGSGTPGFLSAWEVTPASPSVLKETNEYPDWGTALLATAQRPGLTSQSGGANAVRNQFITQGVLTGANDTNYRAINNNFPVFAYSLKLGTVGSAAQSPWTLSLGHVRDPAVSYQGQPVPSLWRSYFGTYQSMLAFSLSDYGSALGRANALDSQITAAATQVGGMHYAAICTLALRQAFAGTELLDPTKMVPALSPALPDGDPWLFVKEISSSGNVCTVDIAYPAFPAFLYTNPELVRLMIDPLIYYPESGKWPLVFAEHDIGASYPNADGHNDGGGENMPVEETANMLIMADAYMRYTPVPGRASAYAQTHYAIFKQWADYLLSTPNGVGTPNALDPQFQNQTDDFTGSIAHSVNLSLKGIIAVGAMGQIAAYDGNMADSSYYTAQAQMLIRQWMQMAQNNTSTHLLLQYQEPANPYSPDTTGEPDSAWSLKYNAFPDRLLGLNLIPASILQEEAAFDTTRERQFGIPLDYRNSYTKTDWELWTVASTDDTLLRQDVFDGIYNAFNTTPDRVPFTDWYEPATGRRTGFLARPVIGGVFAPLFNFTAAPVMSPGPGLYSSGQTVTFTEATPGTVIYYTTDGSLPTASSPVYSGPLPIFRSMNLQAVAIAGGTQASPVAGGVYTILSSPTLQNGSFEKPRVARAGLRYNPLGAVWVFTGAGGIESNGSSLGAASAPDGTQTAFLQGSSPAGATAGSPGAISQSLSFTRAGAYSVTFQAARRSGQVQPLKLTLDGVQVGPLLTPPGNGFSTLTSASFAISTPGRHTLALTATNTSGDLTTFVDQVRLTASALPLSPTALTAKAGGDRVRLTWTAGALAATYTLYRGTTPGGESATPLAAGLTATTYTDTAVTSGTTYYYRVASVNSFGTSPASSEVSATPQLLLSTSEQTGFAWKYTTAAPPSAWPTSTFNDAAWTSSPAGFGTIDFGGSVSRTPWNTDDIWIRRHFPITGSVPASQQFRVFYDEDCEIYINGVLAGSATGYTTSYVALPMTAAGQAALKVGDNVIAVHCHQTVGGQYIDVGIQTAL